MADNYWKGNYDWMDPRNVEEGLDKEGNPIPKWYQSLQWQTRPQGPMGSQVWGSFMDQYAPSRQKAYELAGKIGDIGPLQSQYNRLRMDTSNQLNRAGAGAGTQASAMRNIASQQAIDAAKAQATARMLQQQAYQNIASTAFSDISNTMNMQRQGEIQNKTSMSDSYLRAMQGGGGDSGLAGSLGGLAGTVLGGMFGGGAGAGLGGAAGNWLGNWLGGGQNKMNNAPFM